MTASKLIAYLTKYPNYKIVSDSGWECDATDINGAYINHKLREIVLVQECDKYSEYENTSRSIYEEGYERLYNLTEEEIKREKFEHQMGFPYTNI